MPRSRTYSGGSYEETVYRLDVEKRRDRLGRWTQSSHNALRRVVATMDAAGQTTQYRYEGGGCSSCSGGDKLAALIDANGHEMRWDYDLQGRVTQEARADATTEGHTYETTSGQGNAAVADQAAASSSAAFDDSSPAVDNRSSWRAA